MAGRRDLAAGGRKRTLAAVDVALSAEKTLTRGGHQRSTGTKTTDYVTVFAVMLRTARPR
jgi:hypothetical protein